MNSLPDYKEIILNLTTKPVNDIRFLRKIKVSITPSNIIRLY